MNWQNERVSVLTACTSTDPRTVTLSAWIQSTKTSKLTTNKCDRPALMPHGLFVGGRSVRHLHSASGIVQFDIDLKHNPQLNHDQVKRRAEQCADIVFCARSAGGGLYGFARRRGDLDEQLNEIEQNLCVVLDRCNSRSLAALRFASYDPQPYEDI